jgi:hypothetical protein
MTCSQLALVHKESLFQFCPWRFGRVEPHGAPGNAGLASVTASRASVIRW